MNGRYSSAGIIKAILRKDFVSYTRNKLYLFLTVLSLVLFVIIFWILPDSVDENIKLGIAPPFEEIIASSIAELSAAGLTPEQLAFLSEIDLDEAEEGIILLEFESGEELKGIIEGKLKAYRSPDGVMIIHDPTSGRAIPADAEKVSLNIGLAFPEKFIAEVAKGNRTKVTIYTDAAVPEEIQGAMHSFVRELAFQFAGRELPVEIPDEETIILGKDRMGQQVTMQERMRPILAIIILMVETMAMASLISTEILQRTVTALRVTPMNISHFLTAKTIFGTCLALSQGLLILALVGAFTAENWLLLVLTMLLGSLLFTGIAMIVGSAGKDFMGQLMHTMLYMVPLMIPAFAVLFPGTAAIWVKLLPSYPVVDLLVGVTIYEVGWQEAWLSLLYAFAWVVVLFLWGLIVLKRKVETL